MANQSKRGNGIAKRLREMLEVLDRLLNPPPPVPARVRDSTRPQPPRR